MAEREARRFVEFVHARLKAGGALISKPHSKAIGRASGVRVAEDYADFADADSIDFGDRPPPFVLKPTRLSSKQGVFIISRREGAKYFDEFRKRWLELEEIRAVLRPNAEGLNRFILEEFIPGANPEPIPYDYKMFTFGSEVLFVLQVNRNVDPTAVAFFGKDMTPITFGRELYLAESLVRIGSPVVPANWRDMFDAARRISAHMKTPFVSVDVYTTGKDVILGEATTTPGAPYFGEMYRFLPEFDLYLGDAWRRASESLGIPIPTIADDPPCFAKEEEIFSGRLERSLRSENQALVDQARKANAEIARLRDTTVATRTMFERIEKKIIKLRSDVKKPRRARKGGDDESRRRKQRKGRQKQGR